MSEFENVEYVKSVGLKDDEKLMAMLIYLTTFATTIVGPLLIWLLKKDESEFIDFHGKEYFNFIISFTIYSTVAALSMLLLIGLILLPVVLIVNFVFLIMACVKAYNGEKWKIPLTIRFIK